MSIALHTNNGGNGGDGMRRPRFSGGGVGVPCRSIYEDRRRLEERDTDSCSSSSIGRNSDFSGDEDSGDDEAQSSFRGPLDTMDALEEVLPIKKGISKFYSGKSKSFTSLADAESASSAKDIVKPDNPYNKKRKNLLTRTNLIDKNRSCTLKNIGGGASKRQANFNRSAYLLSDMTSNNEDESSSVSTSPSCSSLPPLHPHGKILATVESSLRRSTPQRQSPWRSFSLSDLLSVCEPTPNISGLTISNEEKETEIH